MAGIVGREVLAHIDVEIEQVAHSIGVFDAVETAQGSAAGIGLGGGAAIQRSGQIRSELLQRLLGRRRPAAWRHLAQLNLAQHFLEGVGVSGGIGGAQGLHREIARLGGVVVAALTILRQHALVIRRGRDLRCGAAQKGEPPGGNRHRAG